MNRNKIYNNLEIVMAIFILIVTFSKNYDMSSVTYGVLLGVTIAGIVVKFIP